jgi:DNA-binding CsgD family transcriptional regulator
LLPAGDLEVHTAHGRRLIDLLIALGRTQEALDLAQDVLARVRTVAALSFELQLAPREAEALARLRRPEALPVAEGSLELATKLGGRPAEALLLRARALALKNAGNWHEAFAGFEAAQERLAALGMRYEEARTLREAGLARLARGRRGDRERAAESLQAARRLFDSIGARRDSSATAGIISAAGLERRERAQRSVLSAREQDVARLVASGLTNREIADRLFITEKTAAYHVGTILSKLGFATRAQIASYVSSLSPSRDAPETPADRA